MTRTLIEIDEEINRITSILRQQQQTDGSWRFCFENGISIDPYVIILLRTLNIQNEPLIKQLHDRILKLQQPEGFWKLYQDDEEGSLSASVDAYYALLFSGYSHATDERMQQAKSYIQSKGGLDKVSSLLTKSILSATGQMSWPFQLSSIPLEILLIPNSFPINIFDFSGYSRVHLVPLLIMADKSFSITTELTPNLHDLQVTRSINQPSGEFQEKQAVIQFEISKGLSRLIGTPRSFHEVATEKAEQFILQRIESDGTLYSYASSTILMIFSLLALGYDKQHPLILQAVQGITSMRCMLDNSTTIENSPSTVWDTALISYALQEAGMEDNDPVIQNASAYLLSRQQDKLADWSIHNPNTLPGGWGFSESNTINPDVDDSTAALRAIRGFSHTIPAYKEAWNRGLSWVLSMQNKDGGWPAFEKNTNKEILTWLAIDGAKSAAIDPSEADLTGRTLEFLGNFTELNSQHEPIKRGSEWLIKHQEKNGSWYGRWGICYIYGTWAALTGLSSTGLSLKHKCVQKGANWLISIQNLDGGWGESCKSDQLLRYIPLGASTPSQTAWALDALIAVNPYPTDAIKKGFSRLIALLHENNWTTSYPTGAGLPGNFYVRYHSYQYIWPLLALSHYKKKYGS